jgi:hypothetical protein
MLKHVALFLFVLLAFHLMQMRIGFSHEVGVIAGPVAFQSDYGQRYNLNTNAGIQVWESVLFIISIFL